MTGNNKYKILLVEDEENICTLLCALFESSGYYALVAHNCAEARSMYSSHVPDLVILDLGLPDLDGSVLLCEVRREDTTPVIVLSAREDEAEKVRLLDMGANDYITKPFGAAELLARVRTALRNNRHAPDEGRLPGGRFTLGDLTIDYDARRVFVVECEVKLTQTEYNILAFLSEHTGKVMTYSSIIRSIWHEYPNEGSIKKLQVNMANIRKKLGARVGVSGYIVNELGVGYRMNG